MVSSRVDINADFMVNVENLVRQTEEVGMRKRKIVEGLIMLILVLVVMVGILKGLNEPKGLVGSEQWYLSGWYWAFFSALLMIALSPLLNRWNDHRPSKPKSENPKEV